MHHLNFWMTRSSLLTVTVFTHLMHHHLVPFHHLVIQYLVVHLFLTEVITLIYCIAGMFGMGTVWQTIGNLPN